MAKEKQHLLDRNEQLIKERETVSTALQEFSQKVRRSAARVFPDCARCSPSVVWRVGS